MNKLTWLKQYAAAASDSSGSAELYTYGHHGAPTSHFPYRGETRVATVGALTVETLRLDDLVGRGELRSPRFLKIDVEGHGHHALRGMKETVASARPIIAIGFHSSDEIEGMMAILRSLHYRWQEIGGESDKPDVESGKDYLFTPV